MGRSGWLVTEDTDGGGYHSGPILPQSQGNPMTRQLYVALFFCLFATVGSAADRPNIVFIFTDDHCQQALSAYDDSRIVTPNHGPHRQRRHAVLIVAIAPMESVVPAEP